MTQKKLNEHIAYIQYKQAKLAEDLAKSMLRGTQEYVYYRDQNNLIGVYIDILYRQDMNSKSYNSLSDTQINNVIEDSYRRMVQYD